MSLHSLASLVGIAIALTACGGSSSDGGTPKGAAGAGSGGKTSVGSAGMNSSGGANSAGSGGTTSVGSAGKAGDNTAGSPSSSGGSGGACPPTPSCFADLATNCQPDGTCVESSNTPTDLTMPITAAQCYSNGVKVVSTISLDASSAAFKATVSKNGTTCFSEEGSLGGTDTTITIKNASGATVATVTTDANGDAVLSCGGKTYTVPANCDTGMTGMMGTDPTNSGTTCTMGECSP